MGNQQNRSQAPWSAMHVKVVPHRLTNLLSQHYTSNETELFFCRVYLSKGFRIIVCWPYVHILFIWYLDLWMHNTRSPPIPKKNSYILNIWSSCGQIGALLVKIRRKSRVLDNPKMILQLSIKKINLFVCLITSSRFSCDTRFAVGIQLCQYSIFLDRHPLLLQSSYD